ncbi:pentapeptide repeat-containing protein [Streptomyces sp. NPDC059578]|uniref:pentapeptide repeat-containing protein n=1 Tax=Streptomyces sp. NPDC059578 TaxID=3346874 RepID=UPI0036CF71FA
MSTQEGCVESSRRDAAPGAGVPSPARAAASEPAGTSELPELPELRADCSRCFALCCVALPFARSSDFAVDKPAGKPCGNLGADFRCGIHRDLRRSGYTGCTVFDCAGAGQQVSQVTFGGRDWRADRSVAGPMFAVFPVMRQLHELLRYLQEVVRHPGARTVHGELAAACERVTALTFADADVLGRLDVPELRHEVSELLLRASESVRAGQRGRELRGADLFGARLRGARLRGASLRGALLVAADLSGADLRGADVIGADLRDADLRGADLTGCLFLTQAQVDAARGDAATVLPEGFVRPDHWDAVAPSRSRSDSGQRSGSGGRSGSGQGNGSGGRSGSGGRRGRGARRR